jgi:hypothetical protein
MNTNAEDIVDGYFACWNEADDDRRSALVAQVWHDDARSVDPLADVTGHGAIASMMGAIQSQMPGHRFAVSGDVRTHHDAMHWGWSMTGPDGTVAVTGIDTALVRDGRIQFLAGFFDA